MQNDPVLILAIKKEKGRKRVLLVRTSADGLWGPPRAKFDGEANCLRAEMFLAKFFDSIEILSCESVPIEHWTEARIELETEHVLECLVAEDTKAKGGNLVWFASPDNIVSFNLTEDAKAMLSLPYMQSRLA